MAISFIHFQDFLGIHCTTGAGLTASSPTRPDGSQSLSAVRGHSWVPLAGMTLKVFISKLKGKGLI